MDNITGIDFSADGRRLVVAGASGMARVFDLKSGELRGTIMGKHLINSVAFSGDGKYLALGARDGHIAVWTAEGLKPVWEAQGHEDIVDQLSFSPDGTHLVTGSWDKSVKIWEASTGRNLNTLKGHQDAVFSVSFSRDGQRVSSGSYDGAVKTWELSKEGPPETLAGHTQGVTSTVFSVDGRRIFSASVDTSLRLWDTKTNEFITVLRDVSPLRDWDTEAGAFNGGIRNASFGIQSLAISPDGSRLIAAVTEIVEEGAAKSYLMIWNSTLPAGREDDPAQTVGGEPGAATAAVSAPAGRVVPVLPQQQSEVARWFDQRTTPRLPMLNFIRFARYGWPRDIPWRHELKYEEALTLKDASAQSYLLRGEEYLTRGDNALAVSDFTEALKLEPNNAAAFGRRGMAHYYGEDKSKAVEDFSKAIELGAPNIETYLLLRGNTFAQRERFDLALADLDRVVALLPDRYLAYAERGRLYLKTGRYDRAAADFSRAIELEPADHRFYNSRGEALYRKGDPAGAIKDFEEAIRKNNGFLIAHYNLACVLFDLGRYDESLGRWETLRQLNPEVGMTMAGEAITLNALGKSGQASDKFLAAVSKDDRFWHCAEGLKDEFFWAKSGCRAAAPIVERIRAELINYSMEDLKQTKPN